MEYLSVKNGKLFRGEKEITLRGFGLGGWLLPEGYMWRLYKKCDRPRRMEAMIEELCGSEYAGQFWRDYYSSYITEGDINLIAEQGFNSVRLPINARHVLIEGQFNESYVSNIDNCLAWCEKNGVHMVLDMHGAPGGQTGQNIDDSENDRPELFMDIRHQDKLVELWTLLAERYRNSPALAGYDLLNEPIHKDDKRYYPQLLPLYFRLTEAIRSVDPNHIIIWEGAHWATDFSIFDGLAQVPAPKNIMLQFHKYWSPPDKESIETYLQTAAQLGLPLYCGEAGENNLDWYTTLFPMLDRLQISWSFWSYKKMEVKNSVSVFPEPERWNELILFLDGGPRPERPIEIFEDLIECIQNPTIHYEIFAALDRRSPLRIPCEAYDSASTRTERESGAVLRCEDPVTLVFADGHIGEPNYRRYGGEAQPESERIYVKLRSGDAVVYRINPTGATKLFVRAGGAGELLVRCGTTQIISELQEFQSLYCLSLGPGPQWIECQCVSGTVFLDYIEMAGM